MPPDQNITYGKLHKTSERRILNELRFSSVTFRRSPSFRGFQDNKILAREFTSDIFGNPYEAPRPAESQNPPQQQKKEIPKNPKTPIIPKSKRLFPKSKRSFPKSKRSVPKSKRSLPKSKRKVFLGNFWRIFKVFEMFLVGGSRPQGFQKYPKFTS